MLRKTRTLLAVLLVLLIVLAACGGDDDDGDKMTQGKTYFDDGLRFILPENAKVDESGLDMRSLSFTLPAGTAGYVVWGPQNTQFDAPADWLMQRDGVSGTTLGEVTTFEVNGNPAAKAEYSSQQGSQGYFMNIYVGTWMIDVSLVATRDFDDQKDTLNAILDSFEVNADKFTEAMAE